MLIPEIRHKNLLLLIHEFGTTAKIAELSGANEKNLSDVKTKKIQPRGVSPRGIGTALAARLGQKCKGDPTWMDTWHDAEWDAAGITKSDSPPGKTSGYPPLLPNQPQKANEQTAQIYNLGLDHEIARAARLMSAMDARDRRRCLQFIDTVAMDYAPAEQSPPES